MAEPYPPTPTDDESPPAALPPGEFGYVAWIQAQLRANPAVPEAMDAVAIPSGDDCAGIRLPGAGPQGTGEILLVTTDMLREGTHFRLGDTPGAASPEAIGRKLLAVSLSDIAAMGGVPRYALASIGFPRQPSEPLKRGIATGLLDLARQHGVALIGGDVTAAPSTTDGLALSLTLIGVAAGIAPVTRGGGRPGDRLFVTGPLGGASLGRHLSFAPRVAQGRWLAALAGAALAGAARARAATGGAASAGAARTRGVSAMIDLSDGLAGDVVHLAEMSGVGCVLQAERIPIAPAARVLAGRTGRPPLAHALSDGEDFELLFALAPDGVELLADWPAEFGAPPVPIGELTEPGTACELVNARGVVLPWPAKGYDHLAPKGNREPAAEPGGLDASDGDRGPRT